MSPLPVSCPGVTSPITTLICIYAIELISFHAEIVTSVSIIHEPAHEMWHVVCIVVCGWVEDTEGAAIVGFRRTIPTTEGIAMVHTVRVLRIIAIIPMAIARFQVLAAEIAEHPGGPIDGAGKKYQAQYNHHHITGKEAMSCTSVQPCVTQPAEWREAAGRETVR